MRFTRQPVWTSQLDAANEVAAEMTDRSSPPPGDGLQAAVRRRPTNRAAAVAAPLRSDSDLAGTLNSGLDGPRGCWSAVRSTGPAVSTGSPVNRSSAKRKSPWSRFHVDITRFGFIPGGGGWRFVGKQRSDCNRGAKAKRPGRRPRATSPASALRTCTPFPMITRASRASRFAARGERSPRTGCSNAPSRGSPIAASPSSALSASGSPHKSYAWRDAPARLESHKRIRPDRPQTKVRLKRFHRTLADG